MRITVRDLMVPAVAVTRGTVPIAVARDLMLRRNATEVYVVDGQNTLLGVVPDYEFLKAAMAGVEESSRVSTLVSSKIEAVEADADIAVVMLKFRESWCSRIAVTHEGRLVGRLTRSELLRLVTHLRQIAAVTEATAGTELPRPHFDSRRERLTPVRKAAKTSRLREGHRVRRLAAS
jgi:CBS domain-containing protein